MLKNAGGLPALAWLKALVLLHVAHIINNTSPSLMLFTTYIFLGLCVLYVGVIINNMFVIVKIEREIRKIRARKRKKFVFEVSQVPGDLASPRNSYENFEDPLQPI